MFTLSLSMAACSPSTGDFGRVQPSYINDQLLPFIGKMQRRNRRELVSPMRLTPNESKQRQAAWSLLRPVEQNLQPVLHGAPDIRGLQRSTTFEFMRTGILRKSFEHNDPHRYSTALRRAKFQSSQAYFNRIITDLRNDMAAIKTYCMISRKVAQADERRTEILDNPKTYFRADISAIHSRLEENRNFSKWVKDAIEFRTLSYRIALQAGRLERPYRKGIEKTRNAMTVFRDFLKTEYKNCGFKIA